MNEHVVKWVDILNSALDIDCKYVDTSRAYIPQNRACMECAELSRRNGGFMCGTLHDKSIALSKKWGGTYEYLCPIGMSYIAVFLEAKKADEKALIVGPFRMITFEDFIDEDLPNNFGAKDTSHLEIEVKKIPYIHFSRVASIADILMLVANKITEATREDDSFDSRLEGSTDEMINTASQGFAQIRNSLEINLDKAVEGKSSAKILQICGDLISQNTLECEGDTEALKERMMETILFVLKVMIRHEFSVHTALEINSTFAMSLSDARDREAVCNRTQSAVIECTEKYITSKNQKHSYIVASAEKYIAENYFNKLTLNEIATHMNVSSSHLCKVFREVGQKSVFTYINEVRVKRAKHLLKDMDISLADVAGMVGYEDQSYFTKMFKKHEGIAPGKYREVVFNLK